MSCCLHEIRARPLDGALARDGVSLSHNQSSVLEVVWSVTYPDTSASTPTLGLYSPGICLKYRGSGRPYPASSATCSKLKLESVVEALRCRKNVNQPNRDEEVYQVVP